MTTPKSAQFYVDQHAHSLPRGDLLVDKVFNAVFIVIATSRNDDLGSFLHSQLTLNPEIGPVKTLLLLSRSLASP